MERDSLIGHLNRWSKEMEAFSKLISDSNVGWVFPEQIKREYKDNEVHINAVIKKYKNSTLNVKKNMIKLKKILLMVFVTCSGN